MKRAFSLVEIIIVVAIVAILAALATPALLGAKKQAHVTDCVSNQRQIGAGLILYAADNGGRVPPWATSTVRSVDGSGNFIEGNPQKWRKALAQYTGSTEVFWCHLDRHRGDTTFASGGESLGDRALVTSFAMHQLVMLPTHFGDKNGSLHLNVDIGNDHPRINTGPSQTVYLTDFIWETGMKLPDGTLEQTSGHGPRANLLYLDGHVANKAIAAP